MAGLDDIKLSLRADEILEGEEVEIEESITSKVKESKNGGQYTTFCIPVVRKNGEKALVWVMGADAAKIKRKFGSKPKDYLGKTLVLGVDDAVKEDGTAITTKDGKAVRNIVIREVRS